MARRSVAPGLTSTPESGFGCTQFPSETWIPPSNSANTPSSKSVEKYPPGIIGSKVIVSIRTVSGFSKPSIRNTNGNGGKPSCCQPCPLRFAKFLPRLNKGSLWGHFNPERCLSLSKRPALQMHPNGRPVMRSFRSSTRRKTPLNQSLLTFTIISVARTMPTAQGIGFS